MDGGPTSRGGRSVGGLYRRGRGSRDAQRKQRPSVGRGGVVSGQWNGTGLGEVRVGGGFSGPDEVVLGRRAGAPRRAGGAVGERAGRYATGD
jgi:hypothetical protein